MQGKTYIKTILPLRLEWEPCYWFDPSSVSPAAALKTGSRVKVSFAGRYYIGVVSATGVVPDVEDSRILSVVSADTGLEDISPAEIRLWRFIADYYMCTVGEVYKAAYPHLKLASEQVRARAVRMKEAREAREEELWKSRIERLKTRLAAKDKALSGRHGAEVTARLRQERTAIAGELYAAQARLAALGKDIFPDSCEEDPGLARISAAPPEQGLSTALASGKPVLLKTPERCPSYISAAALTLRKGRNVLLLVPETGLTGNLGKQLREAFGDLLLVHHSTLTQVQRRRISDAVRSGRPYIVLGTRSAIFLPHRDLGLIIVDSEQSPFYKQGDSSPRYNGRDCAVMLASIHAAEVLLGSSSPSLESLYNCITGKYILLDRSVPDNPGSFTIVDTNAEKRKNGMIGTFSRKLLAACRDAGSVALIRGYEKEEDLRPELDRLFPGGSAKFTVLTIPQAWKSDLAGFDMVVLLSADALFSPDDFRSDEHAFQFLDLLRHSCGKVFIQTANPGAQVFGMTDASVLLEERRIFKLPPYTRLVDILAPGIGATERVTLPRNLSVGQRKKALQRHVQDFCRKHSFKGNVILDADPL